MSTHHPSADGPQGFQYDRRFWVWLCSGTAVLALIQLAFADDALSRALYVFIAGGMAYQAREKARAMRQHGRWIAPLDEAAQADLRRGQTRAIVAISVVLVVGIVIGVTT